MSIQFNEFREDITQKLKKNIIALNKLVSYNYYF